MERKFYIYGTLAMAVAITLDLILGTNENVSLAILGGVLNSLMNNTDAMYENAINRLRGQKQSASEAIEAQKGEDADMRALRSDLEDSMKEQRAHDEGVASVVSGTPAYVNAQNQSRLDKLAQGERTIASMAAQKNRQLAQQKLASDQQYNQQINNVEMQKDKAKSDALSGIFSSLDDAESMVLSAYTGGAGGLFSKMFSKTQG